MLVFLPKQLAAQAQNRRKQLKLSQAEVADLVGLKQKTISALENKPESVKLETLFRILSALRLDIDLVPKEKKDQIADSVELEW